MEPIKVLGCDRFQQAMIQQLEVSENRIVQCHRDTILTSLHDITTEAHGHRATPSSAPTTGQ